MLSLLSTLWLQGEVVAQQGAVLVALAAAVREDF
jgi:hypothetical protein